MRRIVLIIVLAFSLIQCSDEPIAIVEGDLSSIPYNPESYELDIPSHFPAMSIPADNPLTVQGVELGRRLFYDPLLSSDNTVSCSSCHLPEGNFTDNLRFSIGVNGETGTRSSMSLLNVGFNTNGLFWDGRVIDLEEQALLPVEDPLEMNETWENVESKLQQDANYPRLFREAFGINNTNEIDRFLATRAIAQFERTLISSGQSKYDLVIAGKEVFTDEELRGHNIFFDIEPDVTKHAECGHCHNAPLFTTNEYFNNGIDDTDDMNLNDIGRRAVTMSAFDNGLFRTPSLRNLDFSKPFMHDGRFSTLDEVIDHYVSGGQSSTNLSPILRPLDLSPEDRSALKAFIRTLTDTAFILDEAHSNPFK